MGKVLGVHFYLILYMTFSSFTPVFCYTVLNSLEILQEFGAGIKRMYGIPESYRNVYSYCTMYISPHDYFLIQAPVLPQRQQVVRTEAEEADFEALPPQGGYNTPAEYCMSYTITKIAGVSLTQKIAVIFTVILSEIFIGVSRQ